MNSWLTLDRFWNEIEAFPHLLNSDYFRVRTSDGTFLMTFEATAHRSVLPDSHQCAFQAV